MLKAYEQIRTEVIGAMARRGVSQKQISEETGLSPTTIGGFINKRTSPYRNTVVKICDFLDVEWRGK